MVRFTDDVPPMSASQPLENRERSSLELKVNSVIGLRFGSLAPSIRTACMLSDAC